MSLVPLQVLTGDSSCCRHPVAKVEVVVGACVVETCNRVGEDGRGRYRLFRGLMSRKCAAAAAEEAGQVQ